jgi:alpha-L-rhamnosidase
MMIKPFRLATLIILFLQLVPAIYSQEKPVPVNTDWNHERHKWESSWISHPSSSLFDYGVFRFRNHFSLDKDPEKFIVYVSADNRYRLFVNGSEVCSGPARGTMQNWRYEIVDIAPWLHCGENVLAAEVFNLGEFRPVAQFSSRTAFILQAAGESGKLVNTGISEWKVVQDPAYSAIEVTREMVQDYYVAGPCDRIEGSKYQWNWETQTFNDSTWSRPKIVAPGVGRGYMHGVYWNLVPRNIPAMEQKLLRFEKLLKSKGVQVPDGFIHGEQQVKIPAYSNVSLLLDQSYLSVGYPEIIVSHGKGSSIKVTYAEALIDQDGSKGNRNNTSGKVIRGYYDLFLPDGGTQRKFRPLWLRTWRFVQLDIETDGEPLEINDYYGIFTAYPFEEKATFSTDESSVSEIWKTGWRTARLCAGETYMDCPYWEQLQYIGDTRLQSLISLYVSGDDRLMRNALLQIDDSRIPEGLTYARAPSAVPQITPPFSLYWIDMVHDYFMHRDDPKFVRQFLPGIQAVLGWFENHTGKEGMVGHLDWLNFSDWTPGFKVGSPAGVDTSYTALISLNYAYSLDKAAEIFEYFGKHFEANSYREQSSRVKKSVFGLCFSQEKQLLKDTPFEDVYSQHTNIWGVLTDAIPLDRQRQVIEKVLSDKSLIQCTIYFRFYLFQAMKKTGLADKYISQLGPWKEMIAKGLTTFEEGDYDERSDCHAWGSTPNYDLLATVAGIRPSSPGFKTIEIAPAFGELTFMKGQMPHPLGTIRFDLKRSPDNKLTGTIELPGTLTGTLKWKSKNIILGGITSIDL